MSSAPTREQVHEVFVDTLNYHEREGWCAEAGDTDDGGPACVGLALLDFSGNDFAVMRTFAAVVGIDPDNWSGIYGWNDEQDWPTVRAALVECVRRTAPLPSLENLTAPVLCESGTGGQDAAPPCPPAGRAPHNFQNDDGAQGEVRAVVTPSSGRDRAQV